MNNKANTIERIYFFELKDNQLYEYFIDYFAFSTTSIRFVTKDGVPLFFPQFYQRNVHNGRRTWNVEPSTGTIPPSPRERRKLAREKNERERRRGEGEGEGGKGEGRRGGRRNV